MIDGEDGAAFLGDNSSDPATGDTPSQGSEGGSGDFGNVISGLAGDNREFIEKKGWDNLDKVVESYRNLEKHMSSTRSAQAPQTDGERIVPQSASEYELKLGENVSPDGFYDKQFADQFKSWAHTAGLSTKEAQTLHDSYVEYAMSNVQESQQAAQEQTRTAITDTYNTLVKEWGNPETPGFKFQMEMGQRAMRLLDPELKEALTSSGVIVKDADGKEAVANATIFRALAKAGSQLFYEDRFGVDPASAQNNPFDPQRPDLASQGRLIKENPELARDLIKAANNQDWNWFLNK